MLKVKHDDISMCLIKMVILYTKNLQFATKRIFSPLGQMSNGLLASLCPPCAFRTHISETIEDLFFNFCTNVA